MKSSMDETSQLLDQAHQILQQQQTDLGNESDESLNGNNTDESALVTSSSCYGLSFGGNSDENQMAGSDRSDEKRENSSGVNSDGNNKTTTTTNKNDNANTRSRRNSAGGTTKASLSASKETSASLTAPGTQVKGKSEDGSRKRKGSDCVDSNATNKVNETVDATSSKKKTKTAQDKRREDRNAREKERSCRISQQIDDLRKLLANDGVIFPKGTKSSVLTEAAKYIRTLQEHQRRSELARNQLIQQMQMIGSGAQGPQAAAVIRQLAAQHGVWSLGNFGGMPPQAALCLSAGQQTIQKQQQQSARQLPPEEKPSSVTASNIATSSTLEANDYKSVFNSCGVGIAVASMSGEFTDCNQLFCELTNYTKQELCSLTIFNLTDRSDLQRAFDQICLLLSSGLANSSKSSTQRQGVKKEEPKYVALRGAMKSRCDIGLCVSLVKDENGVTRSFCVTLIKNPSLSRIGSIKPIHVSFDAITRSMSPAPSGRRAKAVARASKADLHGSVPTFTTG